MCTVYLVTKHAELPWSCTILDHGFPHHHDPLRNWSWQRADSSQADVPKTTQLTSYQMLWNMQKVLENIVTLKMGPAVQRIFHVHVPCWHAGFADLLGA